MKVHNTQEAIERAEIILHDHNAAAAGVAGYEGAVIALARFIYNGDYPAAPISVTFTENYRADLLAEARA